jgi:maleylacetate reductase
VQAAAHAREAKADLIVAVGGGSVVDAAKIILMCIEHEIADQDGLDGYETTPERRFGQFRNPKVRMIAIPSTLSGGEYNSGSLVTDTRRKLKQIFNHPMMMPRTIILDPAITQSADSRAARFLGHQVFRLLAFIPDTLDDDIDFGGLETCQEHIEA